MYVVCGIMFRYAAHAVLLPLVALVALATVLVSAPPRSWPCERHVKTVQILHLLSLLRLTMLLAGHGWFFECAAECA